MKKFLTLVETARASVGKHGGFTESSQDAIKGEIQRKAFEMTRKHFKMMAWCPQVSMGQEKEGTIRNANQLLDEANDYFADKLQAVFPGYSNSQLKPSQAMPVGGTIRIESVEGGMIGFLSSLSRSDLESLGGTFKTEEELALMAATWAYHFAQRRDPYTYFKKLAQ